MTKKRYAILMRGGMQNYEIDDIANTLCLCDYELDIETKKDYRGVVTTTSILSGEESKSKEIELMFNKFNISYKCLDE